MSLPSVAKSTLWICLLSEADSRPAPSFNALMSTQSSLANFLVLCVSDIQNV
jgi:hypothetical protein